ncbi:MAG: hypothetical protein WBW69_15740 [Candidatus Korobacteraceae bacterium]
MKQLLAVALFVGLAVSLSAAAVAGGGQSAAATSASGGHGTFSVELAKGLDSKKLKEGDEVQAKLTGSITLPSGATVPRGTLLIGHVTEAKARSKNDSEAALGISFDKIVLGKGEDLPIKGVLQAVAPNPNADAGTGTGAYLDQGPSLRMATQSQAPSAVSEPKPVLTEQSTGVLGYKNMTLKDGVVTSSANKEIKFDAGTRFMLSVAIGK